MKRFAGRAEHFARLSALMTDLDAVGDAHADTTLPSAVAAWLGRLKLLHGVPIAYLVPDESLLPVESIRFFAVDRSWLDALAEGAFSIGDATAGDATHTAALTPRMHLAADVAARAVRTAGRAAVGPAAAAGGEAAPGAAVSGPSIDVATGFLLRSQVVTHWPTLEVSAYDAADNPLHPLRMDHLTVGLLLFIVEGTIDHVDVHEPAEGLHFGHDVDDEGAPIVRTRWVTVPPAAGLPATATGDDAPARGAQIAGGSVPLPFRAGATRVVDVAKLSAAIAAELASAHANNEPDGTARRFTAAEFGLEMVEGVASVRFAHAGAQPTSGGER